MKLALALSYIKRYNIEHYTQHKHYNFAFDRIQTDKHRENVEFHPPMSPIANYGVYPIHMNRLEQQV